MKKYGLLLISSIIVMAASIGLTAKIIQQLNEYRLVKEEIAQVLNFEKRILTTSEWIPFSSQGKNIVSEWNTLELSADELYSEAIFYSLILLGVVFLYLGLTIFLSLKHTEKYRYIGIAFIVSSLCFIYLGLQTPFLEIEAYNTNLAFKVPIDLGFYEHTFEKEFEGKISYFYQNKSVFQLIKLLFTGGNIVVAIALLLASIVFPLFKLFTSLWVLIFPKGKHSGLLINIISRIGKWSMADVFVAGIFLAFFAFSNMNVGVETSAHTLIGLYYFLAFVILSIASSYFLKAVVKEKS